MFDPDEKKKDRKKKWQYTIQYWLGRPREGVWVTEPIATNKTRLYEHHTRGKGWTKKVPVVIKEIVEELIYTHHGYRPKFEDEKSARKAFYFRGARIWRT